MIDFKAVRPPMAVAAKSPRLIEVHNENAQLWSADIKIARSGLPADEFKDILFMESFGTVSIAGIEFENGYPEWLYPEHASKQQAFIQFLRDENVRDNAVLGPMAQIFQGNEYAAVAKATAAYIVARGVKMNMGVGYRNNEGGYELVAFEPEGNEFLEMAEMTMDYDELGELRH